VEGQLPRGAALRRRGAGHQARHAPQRPGGTEHPHVAYALFSGAGAPSRTARRGRRGGAGRSDGIASGYDLLAGSPVPAVLRPRTLGQCRGRRYTRIAVSWNIAVRSSGEKA
jgi:hypothetical protein